MHAGWRGIAGGIVPRTLAALELPEQARAWIGPAIGACCYEVGDEVAAAVAEASTEEAVVPGRGARPHLDLQAAVERQLTDCGIGAVSRLEVCTRCHPDLLWSYRREGARAGRNISFLWRRPAAPAETD